MFVLITTSLHLVAASPAGHRGQGYLVAHGLLTVVMLLAWWSARDANPAWAVGAGTVARLVLVAVPTFTTSDVERYLWDGHLALVGFDPYRVAPADPVVAGLRAAWLPRGVHDDLATLYPPGALGLFGVAALAGPATGRLAWKLVTTAASLAMLWAGCRVLRSRARERHLALIAFSPLLVLEGGVGAHVDVVAGAALVLGLSCLDAERPAKAGRWLGAGFLVKFVPALAALPLAVCCQRPGRLVSGMLLTAATGYGLAVLSGLFPVGSLGAARWWRFGSPIWSALEPVVGTERMGGIAVAIGVSVLAVALVVARTGRQAVGIQLALAAPLVASPVVYPWYLVPLAPLVALAPSAMALAWLSTLPLTYEVIDRWDAGGVWEPRAWPLAAIATTVGIAAVVDVVRRRRSHPAARHGRRFEAAGARRGRPTPRTRAPNRASTTS
jgi:hypothetical protein